jgi:hypothetical protein
MPAPSTRVGRRPKRSISRPQTKATAAAPPWYVAAGTPAHAAEPASRTPTRGATVEATIRPADPTLCASMRVRAMRRAARSWSVAVMA